MFRSNLTNEIEIEENVIYNMSKWYKYATNVLIQNIDRLSDIFPGKKYISAEDIIEYIVYGKNGAYILLYKLRGLQKRLRLVEDKIKNGSWVNKYGAGLSKLNSENIDYFINDITKVSHLERLTSLIHEDVYMAYFINTMPDIRLTEPKVPHFPTKAKESVKITDLEEVKHLINNIVPYLTVLEKYHAAITKLVNEANNGLDKLLLR